MARRKSEKYKVGDRVRCYREAPDGATGVVVAVKVGASSPYKVEWDRKHRYSRSNNQTWVSRAVVMGRA
jgi:hypothetical protein